MATIKHTFDTKPVEFSIKLKKYMEKNNLSQRKLSERAGVSKNTVRRYLQDLEKENFHARPDIIRRFEFAMQNHKVYIPEPQPNHTPRLIYTGPLRTHWQPVTPWPAFLN